MFDLLALTEHLPVRQLEPGDELLTQGSQTRALYVLVDGEVEVRKGDVVLAVVTEPGACLGELAVLLERPHSATVVARTASTVRVADDADALLAADLHVARAIAEVLAHRLDLLNGYLADVLHQYGGTGGHLSLLHEVMADLATARPQEIETGSAREPDPLY